MKYNRSCFLRVDNSLYAWMKTQPRLCSLMFPMQPVCQSAPSVHSFAQEYVGEPWFCHEVCIHVWPTFTPGSLSNYTVSTCGIFHLRSQPLNSSTLLMSIHQSPTDSSSLTVWGGWGGGATSYSLSCYSTSVMKYFSVFFLLSYYFCLCESHDVYFFITSSVLVLTDVHSSALLWARSISCSFVSCQAENGIETFGSFWRLLPFYAIILLFLMFILF